MDFKDQFKQLAERFSKLKEQIQTEEATKNAFIMPFIQLLGYDVFNPLEVVPEMDCDISKKKGEKIDYAIMKDGEPIMLFECKHWKQDLNLHETQLSRYFVSSKARFGVLTNGLKYRFYTDLEKANIMDAQPFLEVDFEKAKDAQIEELKKFHKSYFEVDNILSSASELKYMSELRNVLKEEFQTPSPDFVKLLAKRVYHGTMTQKMLDQFNDLVKRSVSSYINDVISDRLNVAIQSTENNALAKETPDEKQLEIVDDDNDSKIVTTEEELEGFYIVKSILRQCIEADRIVYRDVQSYFGILIDDNNRKAVCRLYLNTQKKYIGIIMPDKTENKHQISSIDEIYNYEDELKNAVSKFVEK
jgi:hypothetical protein